jgi:hypothetical protein
MSWWLRTIDYKFTIPVTLKNSEKTTIGELKAIIMDDESNMLILKKVHDIDINDEISIDMIRIVQFGKQLLDNQTLAEIEYLGHNSPVVLIKNY